MNSTKVELQHCTLNHLRGYNIVTNLQLIVSIWGFLSFKATGLLSGEATTTKNIQRIQPDWVKGSIFFLNKLLDYNSHVKSVRV